MTKEANCTQPVTDADLVQRAQQGDVDAFAELFHAHKIKIYSLCLRMTSNNAEAEDLTQETFLLVFRKLRTFRGDSALSTWLYRVAVNTVLMHFRKKGLRQVPLDEINQQDPHAPLRERGEADEQLAGTVDRIALTRAMGALPVGYRTVFLLHEVKGYEHHEIARILRCSIGNSKSQLHKAKARMREQLGLSKLQKPSQDIAGRKTAPKIANGLGRKAAEQPAWEMTDGVAA